MQKPHAGSECLWRGQARETNQRCKDACRQRRKGKCQEQGRGAGERGAGQQNGRQSGCGEQLRVGAKPLRLWGSAQGQVRIREQSVDLQLLEELWHGA